MARLRSLLAATLTVLLVASLGPLATLAGAHPHAALPLTSKRDAQPLGSTRDPHQTDLRGRGHRRPTDVVARAHSRRHADAGARDRRHTHRQARHRTRGYRGVHPAPAANAHPSASTRAVAIAAVLAITCQNTELTPTAANAELVRAAVLCLINRERAQNGEAPLALNQQLEQAAEGHSRDMVAADYFQHVSPSGLTPVDRIRAAGYIPNANVGYVIGENLAWGTLGLATPQAIVNAWIASPGHLANILEAQYTETGIGVVAQVPPSLAGGATGATYSQEFGVIVH